LYQAEHGVYASSNTLAEVEKTFGERLSKDSIYLGKIITAFTENSKKCAELRLNYEFISVEKFIDPLERFIREVIGAARIAKKKFRDSKIQFDSADIKVKSLSLKSDPNTVLLSQTHYYYAKRKFESRFIDAFNKLADTELLREFDVLEYLARLILANQSFFK